MKGKKKGFTLIELLATIVIVSLVFGIGYLMFTNVIDTSFGKAVSLTDNSVRSAARLYATEYRDQIYWENNSTCVPINSLVKFGFFKREQVKDNINSYVYLTRNSSGAIVSDKIDEDGSNCEVDGNNLKYLISADFCNTLTYDGTDTRTVNDFCVKGEDGNCFYEVENKMKYNGTEVETIKNAGLYTVTVKSGDNTKDIQCRVKKAIPILNVDPPASSSAKIGDTNYSVISSDVDGKISVKTSNKLFVIGDIVNVKEVPNYSFGTDSDSSDDTEEDDDEGNDGTVSDDTGSDSSDGTEDGDSTELVEESYNVELNYKWGLRVKILSGKKVTTYLTVTLDPTDTVNYSSATFSYKVSDTGKADAYVPTEEYCRDVVYTGKEQVLVNMPESYDGFVFLNYRGTEIGDYTITARLKYGYVWRNGGDEYVGTNKDYNIICSISDNGPPKVYVKYHMNGGEWGGSTNSLISYKGGFATYNDSEVFSTYAPEDENIDLANWDNSDYINFKKAHSHAKEGAEWNTREDGSGKSFPDTGKIKAKDLCDATDRSCTVVLYVNWVNDDCVYKFNGNGSTGGSMTDKVCSKEETCILPRNKFTKTGYGFEKWTTNSDGTGTSYSDGATVIDVCDGTKDLYVKWSNATYTITFNGNGAVKADGTACGSTGSIVCTIGSDCRLPSNGFCKVGHSFAGWSKTQNGAVAFSNGATVRDLAGSNGTATLYASWNKNNYYLDLNGLLDGKNSGNIKGYGTADVYINGNRVANDVNDFYKAYPYGSTYEIKNIKNATGHHYNGLASGSAALKGTIGAANVGVRLSYGKNVCTITYNKNGGKFNKNKTNVTQTIKYGDTISNMRNATGSSGYYNATRSGYTVTGSIAWISSINKRKFDQGKGYGSTKFCPDLGSKNQSVTLYVNWWRYLYRTCKTGKRCLSAGCTYYNSNCTTSRNCSCYCYDEKGIRTYLMHGNYSSCKALCSAKRYYGGEGSCSSSTACSSCTSAYYKRNASICGCETWNGWGTSSCSVNANTCQRTQSFVKAQ